MAALVCLVSRCGVVEVGFGTYACESAHAEHVVAGLYGSIDANELPLQSNVHDVHVDVHGVLAVWVHRLSGVAGVLVGILAHQKISLVLGVDQVLFLTVHLNLCLVATPRSHVVFLLLHILLRSPSVRCAVLVETMTVPHSIILCLRQVVLPHHAWAEQTIEVFLIHTSHIIVHNSWITCAVSIFYFVPS